jgi:hypothetical protein
MSAFISFCQLFLLVLLQLNKKATINKNVAILDLPKSGEDVEPGTACQVAGWGKTSNKSPKSDILKEVNITIIDRKICNDGQHYNFNPVIGLNMICAGSLKGGKDSCNVSKVRSHMSAVKTRVCRHGQAWHAVSCHGIGTTGSYCFSKEV